MHLERAQNFSSLPETCPLCGSPAVGFFFRDRKRDYLACPVCALLFVPPSFHLDAAAEKAQYDLHCNRVDDPHYRQFLSRLMNPLVSLLTPDAVGLEFGCGPGPALLAMLREAGFEMAAYDPFYRPDETVFEKRYDFITMTEVAEHLASPRQVFDRLFSLLKAGGRLAVMTKRANGQLEDFRRWHYRNDPTHICFFSLATFAWMAQHYGASVWVADSDVVIFSLVDAALLPQQSGA